MAKRKKAGRPKGSKNKNAEMENTPKAKEKRRGRPAGSTNKRGRPAGIARKNNNSLIAAGGHIQGIHFIGNSLIVDTDQMSIEEVIFLGGKTPKVR